MAQITGNYWFYRGDPGGNPRPLNLYLESQLADGNWQGWLVDEAAIGGADDALMVTGTYDDASGRIHFTEAPEYEEALIGAHVYDGYVITTASSSGRPTVVAPLGRPPSPDHRRLDRDTTMRPRAAPLRFR